MGALGLLRMFVNLCGLTITSAEYIEEVSILSLAVFQVSSVLSGYRFMRIILKIFRRSPLPSIRA